MTFHFWTQNVIKKVFILNVNWFKVYWGGYRYHKTIFAEKMLAFAEPNPGRFFCSSISILTMIKRQFLRFHEDIFVEGIEVEDFSLEIRLNPRFLASLAGTPFGIMCDYLFSNPIFLLLFKFFDIFIFIGNVIVEWLRKSVLCSTDWAVAIQSYFIFINLTVNGTFWSCIIKPIDLIFNHIHYALRVKDLSTGSITAGILFTFVGTIA